MFFETPIQDLLIYKPKVHRDNRGYFFESYNAAHFEGRGIKVNFVQDNRSSSSRGTLRGLHLQTGEKSQAKLVSVIKGLVYDVAVDLRPTSPTFKRWFGIDLSDHEPLSLFIPRGFAHGFVVLSETADFYYKVDNPYDKKSESGIRYDDPDLNIDWKTLTKDLILSDKDKQLPTLEEYIENQVGE